MTREQLEHAIRAAADVTGQRELIVIGSQSVLGQYPDAPATLLISQEVDIYAPEAPETSDSIDGSLGEYSLFEKTHGFRVDGVGPETAKLPKGWESRLIPVSNPNTNGATGWCLEVHDIAIAKYFAGREKDLRYTGDLWEAGLLNAQTLDKRLQATELKPDDERRIRAAATRQWRERSTHGRDGTALGAGLIEAALRTEGPVMGAGRAADGGIEETQSAKAEAERTKAIPREGSRRP